MARTIHYLLIFLLLSKMASVAAVESPAGNIKADAFYIAVVEFKHDQWVLQDTPRRFNCPKRFKSLAAGGEYLALMGFDRQQQLLYQFNTLNPTVRISSETGGGYHTSASGSFEIRFPHVDQLDTVMLQMVYKDKTEVKLSIDVTDSVISDVVCKPPSYRPDALGG